MLGCSERSSRSATNLSRLRTPMRSPSRARGSRRAPPWARRRRSLVATLAALLQRGGRLVVAARTDDHNLRFVRRLETAARGAGVGDRVLVRLDARERLHEKGLLGDDYYLS